LETRARNVFPPQTSLKQPENALQEEWYKIPQETVQNLLGEAVNIVNERTSFISTSRGIDPEVNTETGGDWRKLYNEDLMCS
jgi:hypothetical protein